MPPVSVLCAPGAAVLTTTGKPSSRAAATASSACVGDALGHERERRRRAAARAPRRARATRRPPRQRALDPTTARSRVDAVELGDGAERPAQPLGALGGAAERARRRLRVGERGDLASSARASPECPPAIMTTRAPACPALACRAPRSIAAATSSAVALTAGTKSTITASTRGSASRSGSTSRVGLGGRASRACRPGWRRSPRPAGAREPRASPRRAAAARARPPRRRRRRGSRDRRRSSARRRGVRAGAAGVESKRGDVDQLLERPGADHARLAEERVDGRLRAGERRGVRARRARAGAGRAALHREDRLRRATRRATGRTGAGSRTTRGRAGRPRSPGRPPTTRAGRSRRRPPCSRSRRTPRARARASGRLEQREPERAALRREADVARRGERAPANVAFRLGAADEMPRQFGPTSRAPCARTSASSCSWRSTLRCPISAKPAEMTQSARMPCVERLLGGVEHAGRREADDGEVDRHPGSPRSTLYPRTPATGSPSRLTG